MNINCHLLQKYQILYDNLEKALHKDDDIEGGFPSSIKSPFLKGRMYPN